MKNADRKRWCLEHAGEPLTPEDEAYLKEHPEVRLEVERLALMAKLMSLKNHEEPAPHLETRCIARVQERIQSRRERGWLYRLEDALTLNSAPVWAAAAALAVLGAGLWVTLHTPPDAGVAAVQEADPGMPPVSLAAVGDVQPSVVQTSPAVDVASADREIPLNEKPILFLRMESNQLPHNSDQLIYGNGGTMPVRFDY